MSVVFALGAACGGDKKEAAEPSVAPSTNAMAAEAETNGSNGDQNVSPQIEGANKTAADLGPVDPELAKEAMAFLGRISDVVSTHSADCELMASGLEKEVASSQGVIDKVNAADSEKLGKYVEDNHADEMMASSKRMQSGLQNCSSNERVRKALSSLDG